jgi:hypothetical protein
LGGLNEKTNPVKYYNTINQVINKQAKELFGQLGAEAKALAVDEEKAKKAIQQKNAAEEKARI